VNITKMSYSYAWKAVSVLLSVVFLLVFAVQANADISSFSYSYSFDTHEADAETGIKFSMRNMDSSQIHSDSANVVDDIDLRFPPGTRVNSTESIPVCNQSSIDEDSQCWKDARVGKAKALTSMFFIENGEGDIYVRSITPGGRIRLTAKIHTTTWVLGFLLIPIPIDVHNDIDMFITLDSNNRIRTVANLPTGALDLFDGMDVTLNKKILRTPVKCGNYRMVGDFNIEEEEGIPDIEEGDPRFLARRSNSFAIDEGCDKYPPPSSGLANMSFDFDTSDRDAGKKRAHST